MLLCVGAEASTALGAVAVVGGAFGFINLMAVLQTPSATHPIVGPEGRGDAR
jgi:hypothetical protein